jgi:hypothetical protein
MHINLPEFDLSYVAPLKSGNRLIYSSLIELFKLNKIKFELVDISKGYLKNCYMFVRNPLNRFFSSYSWFLAMEHRYNEETTWSQDERKIFESTQKTFREFEINSLSDYIRNYKKFINVCEDFHSLPQTSFLIMKPNDAGFRSNTNFNFRKEYEKSFNGIHFFYRVEEIDEAVEVNRNFLVSINFNKQFNIENTLENQKIKEFDFLAHLPKCLHYQFMVIYTYFKNYYDKAHHLNQIPKLMETITKDEYFMALDMFRKEMLFFGYDDEINLKKINFKKNIL